MIEEIKKREEEFERDQEEKLKELNELKMQN